MIWTLVNEILFLSNDSDMPVIKLGGFVIRQLAVLTTLALLLSSCAGMVYQKCGGDGCHYYKDGEKVSDDEAMNLNPALKAEIEAKRKAEQQQAEYARAPKRTGNEPIFVTILPMHGISQGQTAHDPKTHQYWRNLFPSDSVFQVLPDDQIRTSKGRDKEFLEHFYSGDWKNTLENYGLKGDVLVHLVMSAEDFVGVNTQTNKLAAGKRLVLTAHLLSAYTGKQYKITEPINNILRNQENFNNLASKVKTLINSQIKPEIPSVAWIQERNQKRKAAAAEHLQKVFNFDFKKKK
jgi:hypothetical protein